jgi:ABC-2 type transport system ATP-binding protein
MTPAGDPRIIFSTSRRPGWTPRGRRAMWESIRDLVTRGVTVFLTTRYLEEADQLADRIALLDHGRLLAEGTADELERLVPGGHIRLQFTDPSGLDAAAGALCEAARATTPWPSGSRATAAPRRCAPSSTASTPSPSPSPA